MGYSTGLRPLARGSFPSRRSRAARRAAQKGLPLVDALFDEVGVHLEVEHHRVPPQAEQALFQLFLQLGVIALVLAVAGDTGREQRLGGLRIGLQHKASSF